MLQRTIPSVTPDSTGVEIAAAVLEDIKDPARWCKWALQNGFGQRCLIGSALHVTGLDARYWKNTEQERLVVCKLAGALGFSPDMVGARLAVDMNNMQGHAAVIERLKAAL